MLVEDPHLLPDLENQHSTLFQLLALVNHKNHLDADLLMLFQLLLLKLH